MKYWWNMAVLVVSMISKENTKWIVNFCFPFTEIHNDFREVVSNSLLMNQLFQLYWGFYGRKSQIKFLKYSNTKRVPKLCQTWTITLHWDNSKLFIHAFKLYGKVCPIDFRKKEEPGSCYHILFVATSICMYRTNYQWYRCSIALRPMGWGGNHNITWHTCRSMG